MPSRLHFRSILEMMEMQKPKQFRSRRYWESLTDDQLLDTEPYTDDPESLENLVRELPPGDEEPYVEFKYDLRGSGREKLTCVHGHHQHLAGFVMRKGAWRYLVGWKCGKIIYRENFDQYTADFDAAVNRRDTLRKRREIEQLTGPFMAWLQQVSGSDVFKLYSSVREQIADRMPWLWDNAPGAAYLVRPQQGIRFPRTLFDGNTDPEAMFAKSSRI